LIVQPEPARDRLVANWEYLDSGTFRLVDTALARNHEADPIWGPPDRGFMNGGVSANHQVVRRFDRGHIEKH
jgi:hypothetical protein